MNLLEETVEDLRWCGHATSDIIFIGSSSSGHSCTWDQFEKLADKEYDAGHGRQEVAVDLVIVFRGGSRLQRKEYDGAEQWCYLPMDLPPDLGKPIRGLISEDRGWRSLEEINEEGDKS